MLLEVTKEEYQEFYKEIERYKYTIREAKRFNIYSINEIIKNDSADEFRGKDIIPDLSVDINFEVTRAMEVENLKEALLNLNNEEYEIIKSLFYEEKTVREYAQKLGIPYATVQYRKKQILKKLKKILKI